MEDFVLWVPPVSSRPPDWEEEEEEDGMSDLFITLLLGSGSEMLGSSKRLMPSSKWPGDWASLARMRVRRCRQLSSQVHPRWV